MSTLFEPVRVGSIRAANRIAMAPLTRDRAGPRQVPTELMATYYGQRATAGLIISEGTQISAEGQGYLDTPGIYSAEQIAGWRRVTDTVHAHGGKIIVQLWHVGRISHTSLLPAGTVPASSTARKAVAQTFTANGFQQVSPARALRTDELSRVVTDFRAAARNAIAAGFDGVEVHGAHGYLVEQFLRDSVNDRTDAYGGSIENRARFAVEVMTAVAEEIGAGRAGIRLSPMAPVNDSGLDSQPQATYDYVVRQFAKLQLAFVHVVEGSPGGARETGSFDYAQLRSLFKDGNPDGAWIVNNGYTLDMAGKAIASGASDLVAFGRYFISNPDLVDRLARNAQLTPVDAATMYGGDARGYTDYPVLQTTSLAG